MIKFPSYAAASLIALLATPTIGARANEPIGIILAVGDIASCGSGGSEKAQIRRGERTAAVVKAQIEATTKPVRIPLLGDIAYEDGTGNQWRNCFDTRWGQFKDLMLPVPGNHDKPLKDYLEYVKDFPLLNPPKPSDTGKPIPNMLKVEDGYYYVNFPYPTGPWRLMAINSYLPGDRLTKHRESFETDLRLFRTRTDDFEPVPCVLAFSHAPYYSSGRHGHGIDGRPTSREVREENVYPEASMEEFFRHLLDQQASVLVSGHEHGFEQIGRHGMDGKPPEPVKPGIRSFVVGTDGRGLYPEVFENKVPAWEAYDFEHHGILKIELEATSYSWSFLPIAYDRPDRHKDGMVVRTPETPVIRDTCNR